MGYNKRNGWPVHRGHPPFEVGDRVTPKDGGYQYDNKQHGWPRGEYRTVKAITTDENGYYYTLTIWNPVAGRNSNYTPNNFTKQETTDMATERTKYFALKLEDNGHTDRLAFPDYGKWEDNVTVLRDSAYAVKSDVAKIIQHGDRYLVLQTIALIEGEEPRPPIRVTEYK